ncbi:hypothetical protein FRB99_006954, partial [Tulasnella sp. 403]
TGILHPAHTLTQDQVQPAMKLLRVLLSVAPLNESYSTTPLTIGMIMRQKMLDASCKRLAQEFHERWAVSLEDIDRALRPRKPQIISTLSPQDPVTHSHMSLSEFLESSSPTCTIPIDEDLLLKPSMSISTLISATKELSEIVAEMRRQPSDREGECGTAAGELEKATPGTPLESHTLRGIVAETISTKKRLSTDTLKSYFSSKALPPVPPSPVSSDDSPCDLSDESFSFSTFTLPKLDVPSTLRLALKPSLKSSSSKIAQARTTAQHIRARWYEHSSMRAKENSARHTERIHRSRAFLTTLSRHGHERVGSQCTLSLKEFLESSEWDEYASAEVR